jgi:cytochrome P450
MYIGFGAGRHKCAGEKFSLAAQNDVLSTLFGDYDVEMLTPMPQPTWAGADSSPLPTSRVRVKLSHRKK